MEQLLEEAVVSPLEDQILPVQEMGPAEAVDTTTSEVMGDDGNYAPTTEFVVAAGNVAVLGFGAKSKDQLIGKRYGR